jgi:microsomal dipeptidase-like Zn-dependent dipeptidase
VAVSHTGVRGTCDNIRNLNDEEIVAVAQTGGVIGIGFWKTAVCGSDVEAIVRAMRYVADLVGVEHVALGSDFDGTVTTPFDASQMSLLTDALLEDGFTPAEVEQIMGRNVVRVLKACLP